MEGNLEEEARKPALVKGTSANKGEKVERCLDVWEAGFRVAGAEDLYKQWLE